MIGALALLAAALAAASAAAPALPAEPAAAAAFAQLKTLVGTWRNAARPELSLRIRFYLTARDTVLVESWEAGGKPHSLTLYHRDGPALIATHYCPQGNQPRLALTGADKQKLHFAFRDFTDLDPATELHQHDLWFDLADPASPKRGEVYRGPDGKGPPEWTRLVRDKE